jgi:hypothetical protein
MNLIAEKARIVTAFHAERMRSPPEIMSTLYLWSDSWFSDE